MFKSVVSAVFRTLAPAVRAGALPTYQPAISALPTCTLLNNRQFHSVNNVTNQDNFLKSSTPSLTQLSTLTKFSARSGKRKSVAAVTKRFYRLNWGIWIHTRSGRHKKLWKKSQTRKNRLRDHVFCNATQSTLLDKMVTKFWKKPFYFVDDPYAPYHSREEFPITRKKPAGM